MQHSIDLTSETNMTKKDYIVLAEALAASYPKHQEILGASNKESAWRYASYASAYEQWLETRAALLSTLMRTSSTFDAQRFVAATEANK